LGVLDAWIWAREASRSEQVVERIDWYRARFVVANISLNPVSPSSEVRILNNSPHLFHQLVINGELYGNINAGEFSGYRNSPVAYRYASVRLSTVTHEMHLTPDNYVARHRWEAGNLSMY